MSQFNDQEPQEIADAIASEKVDESPLEEEDSGGGCARRGCFYLIIILLLLLLLLLFLPVKKKPKRVVKRPPKEHFKGKGVAGTAKYYKIKAIKTYNLGSYKAGPKEVYYVVDFYVKNLSSRKQVFDYPMVKLTDEGERLYLPDIELTAAYLQEKGKVADFPRAVGSKKSIRVQEAFHAERAATKVMLVGSDFDLTNFKNVTLDISKVETRGKPSWVRSN